MRGKRENSNIFEHLQFFQLCAGSCYISNCPVASQQCFNIMYYYLTFIVRKLRFRELTLFAQGHMASRFSTWHLRSASTYWLLPILGSGGIELNKISDSEKPTMKEALRLTVNYNAVWIVKGWVVKSGFELQFLPMRPQVAYFCKDEKHKC